MFKYTIVIAALAVSASLAISIPTGSVAAGRPQEPISAANMMAPKMNMPEKVMYVSSVEELGTIESGVFGLMKTLRIPKKMMVAAVGYAVSALKSMNVKKLLHTALVGALVGALVTVLGAVAAVAVAGLVSIVSGICALLPYFKFVFGRNDVPESHIDEISHFVMGALDTYDMQHKA